MWRITLMYLFFTLRCVAGESELPASTKATMEAYAKSYDKLSQDYAKALKEARTKAISGLARVQEAETKKGNLEGALVIKKKIEELQSPDEKQEEQDVSDLLGGITRTVSATIHAAGYASIEIRVNGEKCMNADHNNLTIGKANFKAGDIITVKNIGHFPNSCLFLIAVNEENVPIFWTTKVWMSYVPTNFVTWHDVTDKKLAFKPSELAGERPHIEMTLRIASGMPGYKKDMPIIAPTLLSDDKASYMVYRVTAQDLVPKK